MGDNKRPMRRGNVVEVASGGSGREVNPLNNTAGMLKDHQKNERAAEKVLWYGGGDQV